MNNWTNQILQSYGYGNQLNPDYSIPRLLQYTVGIFGAPNCDYNFAADAATHDPQILDLGLVLPYQWSVTGVIVECTEAVAGVADFGIAAGQSAACTCLPYTLLAGLGNTAVSGTLPLQDISTVRHFYFLGDPTSLTWDDMTAGKWLLTIMLNDYSKL